VPRMRYGLIILSQPKFVDAGKVTAGLAAAARFMANINGGLSACKVYVSAGHCDP